MLLVVVQSNKDTYWCICISYKKHNRLPVHLVLGLLLVHHCYPQHTVEHCLEPPKTICIWFRWCIVNAAAKYLCQVGVENLWFPNRYATILMYMLSRVNKWISLSFKVYTNSCSVRVCGTSHNIHNSCYVILLFYVCMLPRNNTFWTTKYSYIQTNDY